MVSFESSEKYGVYDLLRLIKILRSSDGCPWDREQTHESIRRNFIEEAYEAAEAIDERDAMHLLEELGDVLVQVIFHSDIEEGAGSFDFDGVADAAVRKLLYRHPHVFGTAVAESSDKVLSNWDELKQREKGQETVSDSLCAVARSLPALWRAEKVQKKAAKADYIRDDMLMAMDKLREELGELEAAVAGDDMENAASELGDMLFSAVNIARHLSVDPEDILTGATDKFISRYSKVEDLVLREGRDVGSLTFDELEEYYNRAKNMI